MRSTLFTAVTAGLVIGLSLPAALPFLQPKSNAGTALRMDLEETFHRSDLVLEGRVVGGRSAATPAGTIYTDWEVAVERTFWGEDLPVRTIRIPGGVLEDGRGLVIPGLPRLRVGEDVVLLLGEPSHAGLRMPTGLGQGKFQVLTDRDGTRTAQQTGEHLTLVDGARSRMVRGVRRYEHGELVARLEAASQARSASGSWSTTDTEDAEDER